MRRAIPVIIFMFCLFAASASSVYALTISGPSLTQEENLNEDFGLIIEAKNDISLVSVRFPNRGLADIIELRDATGFPLRSVNILPGENNKTVDLNYVLSANETYQLVSTKHGNRYFASYSSFPFGNTDLTVLSSFDGSTLYWASFNDIVTSSCVEQLSGLISWFPGDGNSYDIAGSNNGALQNGADFAPGIFAQAFSFDGVDDYLQILSPSGLPTGSSARTITLWFRTPRDLSASTDSTLIQYGTSADNNLFGLITSGTSPGKLYFQGYNNDLSGITDILADTWYHAALTYDGTTVSLYLDGQEEDYMSPVTLDTVIDADGFLIGGGPGLPSWEGLIDEVKIFNRALSEQEILTSYYAESIGMCTYKSDIALTMTDSPDPVEEGGTLTYTLTITNNGPDVASDVFLTDVIPTETSYVSATSSQGACNELGGTVTCDIGDMNNGAAVTVTIVVTVGLSGEITNTADITCSTFDPSNGNNTDTETTTVALKSDLSLTMTDSPDPIEQGETLTYILTITNNGPYTATGVILTDVIPAAITYVSAETTQGTCSETDGTVTCDIGDMNISVVTVTITVTAVSIGTISNTANVKCSTFDPSSGNNTDTETTTITGPYTNLTLISPNGGEKIESGSVYTIRWGAPTDAVSFKLSYSFNNGLKWRKLAKGLTGDSYEWTVPVKRDNLPQCLIRVTSYDEKKLQLEQDDSDSSFEIMVLDITSPAEEESFYSEDDVEITWDTFTTSVASVTLSYSIDCGVEWKDIETLTGDDIIPPYTWKVPPLKIAPDCSLIKVKLKDIKGKSLGTDSIQLTLLPSEPI